MKQTESLLKNGYVTSRGKAYAGGTAYAKGGSTFAKYSFSGNGGYTKYDVNNDAVDQFGNAAEALKDAASDLSDAAGAGSDTADEFRETFDWIEVRIEEINEQLSLKGAQLENTVGASNQNAVINEMIQLNETLYENLLAGANKYYSYAQTLLGKVPAEYRKAAQDGTIAIEEFVGEVDEKTLESIQEYREWVQKGADATQQAEEVITEIQSLAKQAFDNIAKQYDNKTELIDAKNAKIQAVVDLVDEQGNPISTKYYSAMSSNVQSEVATKRKERADLQKNLDTAVENGNIPKYSDDWYDEVKKILGIDAEIVELETDLESYQNAMNDIYWDNFEEGISRIEYMEDETQNLIDLMGNIDEPVDDDGKWTNEGITAMGLYAQQMEIAEYKSQQYAKAINDLTADYKAGKYSQSEYIEKLNELKSKQYDSIGAYYEAQDAIKDLQKTRVDAIKNGIDKEVDAYDELIQKKKEALSAEQDLHDFQKTVAEQEKNIADIKRQLAAIENDNSASARAKRAQLKADLAEAQADLKDTYYQRSVEQQEEALDKENENFKKAKEDEKTAWDKWLENTDGVLAESLSLVRSNSDEVYKTLNDKADKYGLVLSDTVVKPWESGASAIDDYSTAFGDSSDAITKKLEEMTGAWQDLIKQMDIAAKKEIKRQKSENTQTVQATKTQSPTAKPPVNPPKNNPPATKAITVGGKINASGAKIYNYAGATSGYNQYFASDPVYVVLDEQNGYLKVRHHKSSSGVTGWFKKSDVKALAVGTKKLGKSGIVNVDELGEELILGAKNGRLTYLEKGSGVVPADLTANLMQWGELDPQDMLDRNRPSITPNKSVVNNTMEISVDASVGELVHIDHFDGNNLDDITEIIGKTWDKKMQELNNSIKRYTRR